MALYEVGNLLVRPLKWSARDVADQLDDLLAVCGTPLVLSSQWLRDAYSLPAEHSLSFYDAAWAATARGPEMPLISAGKILLSAGLAESPAQVVRRLRLPMPR